MTGKEKCRLLRQIRREIAESNGIPYSTEECTFEGACTGTCPRCEEEVRVLEDALTQKAARGERIALTGLSLDTFEQSVRQGASNESEKTLSLTIDELPMFARIRSRLREHGILTVRQILENNEEYYLSLLDHNLGRRNTDELKRTLRTLGLELPNVSALPEEEEELFYGCITKLLTPKEEPPK